MLPLVVGVDVFPARAGMNRTPPAPGVRSGRVPRASGDEPPQTILPDMDIRAEEPLALPTINRN